MQVFKATLDNASTVAVKFLKPSAGFWHSRAAKDAFRKEARLQMHLDSPEVVGAFGAYFSRVSAAAAA